MIKIELNYSLRAHILEPVHRRILPELLFDDEEIIERIKEHPMALWKCQQ